MSKKKTWAKRSSSYKERISTKKKMLWLARSEDHKEKDRTRSRIRMRNNKTTVSARYSKLKSSAKNRGLEVTLTKPEYSSARVGVCYYCSGAITPTAIGLDRLDNTRGYHLDNVVACCGPCNQVRGHNLSVMEMQAVAKLLNLMRK